MRSIHQKGCEAKRYLPNNFPLCNVSCACHNNNSRSCFLKNLWNVKEYSVVRSMKTIIIQWSLEHKSLRRKARFIVTIPKKYRQSNLVLKFGHFVKGTKSKKIFHLKFDATELHQFESGRFFQILCPSQNVQTLRTKKCSSQME